MTTTVRQMLAGRTDLYSVTPQDTIYDALQLMADKNIGAVLVLSGDERSAASFPSGITPAR